jgi:hypothetical protein
MSGNVEHQMTEICHFVDKFLETYLPLTQRRHSPHAQPLFSNAKALMIVLLQGVLEAASLKQTYRLAAQLSRFLLAATCYHLPLIVTSCQIKS